MQDPTLLPREVEERGAQTEAMHRQQPAREGWLGMQRVDLQLCVGFRVFRVWVLQGGVPGFFPAVLWVIPTVRK